MKLNSIQFLRAVAVMLVVYMHSINLQAGYSESWQQNFFNLKRIGGIGVDIFFVISGFIISYVAYQYKGLFEGIYFLKKRFTRINPIYYLTTLIFAALLIIQWLTTNSVTNHKINQLAILLFDSFAMVPTSKNMIFFPLLVVGWTLSFEWFFYILYFFLISFKVNKKFSALCIATIALATIGYIMQPSDYRLAFLSNPIILEFMLGSLIYMFHYYKIKKIPQFIPIAYLFIGIVTMGLLVFGGFDSIEGLPVIADTALGAKRFILFGIPSSLIVAGVILLERHRFFKYIFNNRSIITIGNASFSIYLTHSILFFYIQFIYKKTGNMLSADIIVFIQLCIAILFGIGFYKFIENPILRLIHTNSKALKRNQINPLLK
jgi:exopolysaccharide production protein ExoZ